MNPELAQKYLTDKIICKIKVDDLADYIGFKMNVKPRPKKKEVCEKVRDVIDTEDKVKEFYSHFKNELAIPGFLVNKILNIKNSERKIFVKENKLHIIFLKLQDSSYGYEINVDYYDSYEIMQISNDTINAWRKEHKENVTKNKNASAVKAANTRKKRTENMPDWIKNTPITWIEKPQENLKRAMAISKLANDDYIQTISFSFGHINFFGRIKQNGKVNLCININKDVHDYIYRNQGKIKKYKDHMHHVNVKFVEDEFANDNENKMLLKLPIEKDSEKICDYIEKRIRTIINSWYFNIRKKIRKNNWKIGMSILAVFEKATQTSDKDILFKTFDSSKP